MRISLTFVAALLACAAACSESSAPTATDTTAVPGVGYTVRDLTPTIGDSSTALRLNNSGELVGIAGASLDPAKRPFLWNNGAIQFIDGCGYPEDLNNVGAVLCVVPPHATVAIWKDGVVTPFVPFDTVGAHGNLQLNDSGYVTEGYAGVNICGPVHYCALVGGRTTLTVMPSTVAILQTIAITTRGDVLAEGDDGNLYYQPALLFDATGTTVRSIAPDRNGSSVDMNDSDHVVGGGAGTDGVTHAWYWHAGIVDTIGPGTATSINNSDVVVGTAGLVYAGGTYGFRWQPGTAAVRLDSLIADDNWTIESAKLINDAGQILATGSNATLGVHHHVVLLEPPPSSP